MQKKTTKWTEMLRLILYQSIISRLPLTGSFNKLEQRKIFSDEKTLTLTRLNKLKLKILKEFTE